MRLTDFRQIILPGLAVAMLFAAAPVHANDIPACNAGSVGVAQCLDGVLCLCRYQQSSALTGLQAGYRWNCGLNRPYCGNSSIHHQGLGSAYRPNEVFIARDGRILNVPVLKPRR